MKFSEFILKVFKFIFKSQSRCRLKPSVPIVAARLTSIYRRGLRTPPNVRRTDQIFLGSVDISICSRSAISVALQVPQTHSICGA